MHVSLGKLQLIVQNMVTWWIFLHEVFDDTGGQGDIDGKSAEHVISHIYTSTIPLLLAASYIAMHHHGKIVRSRCKLRWQ